MKVTIFIPRWSPVSTNKLTGKHWAKAHRLKKADVKMLDAYARLAGATAAVGKRRVAIVVVKERPPLFDPDNILKSGLDALKRVGLIVDDSRRWCEWSVPVVRLGKGGKGGEVGTTFVLEDVSDGEEEGQDARPEKHL